jgi:hypothetical protein
MRGQLAAVDQADNERARQTEHVGRLLRRHITIIGEHVHDASTRQVGQQLLDGSLRNRWQTDLALRGPDRDRCRAREPRREPLAVTRLEFECRRLAHRYSLRPKRHKHNCPFVSRLSTDCPRTRQHRPRSSQHPPNGPIAFAQLRWHEAQHATTPSAAPRRHPMSPPRDATQRRCRRSNGAVGASAA